MAFRSAESVAPNQLETAAARDDATMLGDDKSLGDTEQATSGTGTPIDYVVWSDGATIDAYANGPRGVLWFQSVDGGDTFTRQAPSKPEGI